MQPYLFPYIGYFQLIAQSDVFVLHDDVQYIKDGWVNRNRILDASGEPSWITLPVNAAGHTEPINARAYVLAANAGRILRKIESAYFRAPPFREKFPLVRQIMEFADANVAAFNVNALESVAARLGLRPRFLRSSQMEGLNGLKGQARVIAICKRLGATHYVNSIGGTALYDAKAFAANG